MKDFSCMLVVFMFIQRVSEQSIHAKNLMRSMVYCDLGTEHPRPKPNDVHGLVSSAIWEQSIRDQNSMTSMVYCDLGTEHPRPKPNDVHGLVRFGNRASTPKT